jgi:hypothetical protein
MVVHLKQAKFIVSLKGLYHKIEMGFMWCV